MAAKESPLVYVHDCTRAECQRNRHMVETAERTSMQTGKERSSLLPHRTITRVLAD